MTWYANERIDGPTSVYVMECAGRSKVGLAVDVAQRRAALQTACPLPIVTVGSIVFDSFNSARFVERSIHERFAATRMHGEWFSTESAEMLDALEGFRSLEYAPPSPQETKAPRDYRFTDAERQMMQALEF